MGEKFHGNKISVIGLRSLGRDEGFAIPGRTK
jgi:hypothetical protein